MIWLQGDSEEEERLALCVRCFLYAFASTRRPGQIGFFTASLFGRAITRAGTSYAAHAPSRFSYIGGSLGYFREPRHMILAIAALADGRYITGATDGALKVWAAPPPSGIGKPLDSE